MVFRARAENAASSSPGGVQFVQSITDLAVMTFLGGQRRFLSQAAADSAAEVKARAYVATNIEAESDSRNINAKCEAGNDLEEELNGNL